MFTLCVWPVRCRESRKVGMSFGLCVVEHPDKRPERLKYRSACVL